MIKRQTPVVLIIGESGSGKNAVQDELERLYGYVPLLSYTTRPKRNPNEDTHTFVTEEVFDQILNNETVMAFTQFDGYRYCATDKQLEQSDIYIVDVKGLQTLTMLKMNGKITIPFITIYLQVPEEERIKRMANRGDSQALIQQRIEHDRIAFEDASKFCEYTIDNIDSTLTAQMIYTYIWNRQHPINQTSLNNIYDIEKEIIDKLCIIQTLMKSLNANIDDIEITISGCQSNESLQVGDNVMRSNRGNNMRIIGYPDNGLLIDSVIIDFATKDKNHTKLLTNNIVINDNSVNIARQIPNIRIK